MADDPNPIEDDFDTPALPDMDAVRAALGRKAATEFPVCGVRDWLISDGTNLIYPTSAPPATWRARHSSLWRPSATAADMSGSTTPTGS